MPQDSVGPLGPSDIKLYKQEYRQGADQFQQALDQYTQSKSMYQQSMFKDVMDQAMNVLNETARSLKDKKLLSQNESISKDYSTFQKFPDDPDTQEKLKNDLEQAKKLSK